MIGQRLGSFLVEGKIGSGAMGDVYLAVHEKLGRKAAVKVISGDFLQRENALQRFTREAEILEQLRHPNIVRYFARGRSRGTFYYAMEYVEGRNLDDMLEERGYLPWREVVDLAIQLCEALQYAHTHGVVHRDLKPSNLMLTSGGQIKLTDFGIAKDLDASVNLTRTGRTLGTAAYMAPEQIRGTPGISHKTDLYALGCLLFQMLTGQPPFQGKSAVVLMHAHMTETPPRPSSKNPEIPRALDDLVIQLMAKEPSDRPWDADIVCHSLQQLRDRADRGETVKMAFDPVPASSTIDGVEVARPKKRRKKAAGGGPTTSTVRPGASPHLSRQMVETALLVLALAVLMGFAGYMLWPPSDDYLHARASELMASKKRADWDRARWKYIEPLEERFPDHPWQDEVGGWIDTILEAEAKGRADALTAGIAPFNRPANDVERDFLQAHELSSPYANLEQHALVAQEWEKYIQKLERRDDPDERGWLVLGRDKIAEQAEQLQRKRAAAMQLRDRALSQSNLGRDEEAKVFLQQILADYQRSAIGDPELTIIINWARSALEKLDRSSSTPEPGEDSDPEASPDEGGSGPDPGPVPAPESP